ncbi:MAG: radical SAM protein [Sutterella sp.]|nr:radical SAM protein [Sutterella sp.]
MSTILFASPVFGPIISRRLGVSLGVNLLPGDGKLCNFDCIYCECGLNNEHRPDSRMPSKTLVISVLEDKLKAMQTQGQLPDTITFAGNGEPTLHPDFPEIIDETIRLRNQYAPKASISVLTNATHIDREPVFQALMKVDNPLLKLDTVDTDYIRSVDRPTSRYDLPKLIDKMRAIGKHGIIQTMFLKGTWEGRDVSNVDERFVTPWLEVVKSIGPKLVTIYTIDRETPRLTLQKATKEELDHIAERIREAGLEVSVSY